MQIMELYCLIYAYFETKGAFAVISCCKLELRN